MKRTATLILGLLMAAPAFAQPDRASGDAQDVVWARDIGQASITLDGTLSEPEWAQAESINIKWDAPVGFPGSGQFIETNPFGLADPTDPIDATVSFLRKGNVIYIAVNAKDKSVGGSRSLWNMDGVFMSIANRTFRPDNFALYNSYSGFNQSLPDSTANGARIREEIFYSWWNGDDTTSTGEVAPGISPLGRSTHYGGGLDSETDERSVQAWNYASTVDGVSNDDMNGGSTAVEDGGYILEMMISADSLGYDFQSSQPANNKVPLSITIQDTDYNWPQDGTRFISTRAWWQNRWGNNFIHGVAYIAGDPSVTVSSGPIPEFSEPEFTVPTAMNAPEPTLDGSLDEPAWAGVEPQFRLKYLADPDANDGAWLDANLPGTVAPNNVLYFHGDSNPVLDPSVGNISMFYRGSKLYIGLDVDDQSVSSEQGEGLRDGFRLNIRSLDSTDVCCEYTLDHIRMDFSIDTLASTVRIENVPDEVTVGDPSGVMAALSLKDGSTTSFDDFTDLDEGYQMEVMVDLTSIGYPEDLDGEQIWVSFTYFDGDILDDLPTGSQNYGTRTWIAHERSQGAIVYGYLDPTAFATADENGPGAFGELRLMGSYPNPTTGAATLRYELARTATVEVEVFDVLGRLVQRVETGLQEAGRQSTQVDASALSAGSYVYRVRLDDGTSATGRMLIVR